jgi:E3 ubiquitin-protein ligase HERC1
MTTRLSDGTVRELMPNGASQHVTWENRHHFARLVLGTRLAESAAQLGAIRKGFNTVVPVRSLQLLHWKELEELVCGSPNIDVEALRRHTLYRGVLSASHPVVQTLWEVLREMSQRERQQFVRFCWGRGRLPVRDSDWTQPFTLTVLNASGTTKPDDLLPVSHTCFHQLDIPLWSNKAVMRSKILYAAANCKAIDADFEADRSAMAGL